MKHCSQTESFGPLHERTYELLNSNRSTHFFPKCELSGHLNELCFTHLYSRIRCSTLITLVALFFCSYKIAVVSALL